LQFVALLSDSQEGDRITSRVLLLIRGLDKRLGSISLSNKRGLKKSSASDISGFSSKVARLMELSGKASISLAGERIPKLITPME